MVTVSTKEITEAAVYYMHNLELLSYKAKYWIFGDPDEKAARLSLSLINKKISVEPLEFMDAIRRVKSFSNGSGKAGAASGQKN